MIRRQTKSIFATAGLLAALLWPTVVGAATSNVVKTPRVTAQMVVEHTAVIPGRSTAIALKLKHIKGWHTYWRNPGDSGLPTTIKWQLPERVRASEIQWPTPQRIPFGPFTNFGYEGEVWLISDLNVPADYAGKSVTLNANVDWLVCSDKICIPENGKFQLTLPVTTAQKAPLNQQAAAGFVRSRARHPVKAEGWRFEAKAETVGASVQITPPIGTSAPGAVFFLPYKEGQIEPSASQALRLSDANYVLELPRAATPTTPLDRLHGILIIENAAGTRAVELDVPVSRTMLSASGNGLSLSFAVAVLFAFLGGIILNAMPCVFPVLSIKVLGFAHESNVRRARRHGVFYGIGVVVSFWLLAALLLGLRAAGEQIGWGFQLQSPVVVTALAVLFFLLALNLLGFFEVGHVLPSAVAAARTKHPDSDAFLSGVLAVAIASPCTAPFMGAALGYAVTQSNAASLVVFTALGVGMALPYVLLAWFPRARRMLPKPGAWMERLRQLLAFPLLATVVWLAWILGVQLGVDALAYLLIVLLLVGLGVWLLRLSTTSRRKPIARAAALLVVLGAIAVTVWIARLPFESAQSAPDASGNWAPYSAQAVSLLNAQGKTVFVDFTAAWCVTCQVNKKLVLDTKEVQDAFSKHGIATLRADWTRRDPEITQALDTLGRSGVPAYVIQPPGRAPRLLPELLTKDIVLQALDAARH
jgi:thiol:disulfide interchange protein